MKLSAATVDAIKSGYDFPDPVINVGALLNDQQADSSAPIRIPLNMFNRHGLIAGATGTGKTVTLQVLAEQLSAAGVPVFAADIKGDLTGLAQAGQPHEKISARADAIGQDWAGQAAPVEALSLGGFGTGIPIRASVTSFGPLLLAKVLELNQTQESVLALLFHYADSNGLALLDLTDVKALLSFLDSPEGKAQLKSIGGISSASVGVILRKIAALEAQGADAFFGEPEFETADLLRLDESGKGIISLLELPALQQRPALFSTFMMWLLADLFQELPEVGDTDKPRLVFFFDEAHLLFKNASAAFLDSVVQTVRLIRSKGVGIFFVTQSPKDVPGDVLAQLGSRVQHQLRAHTPNDAKALKAAVQTYPTTDFDLAEVLTSLGTGEAVVTVLDPDGSPTPVAPTLMRAPVSRIGNLEASLLEELVAGSSLRSKYAVPIDRESAREILERRAAETTQSERSDPTPPPYDPPARRAPRNQPKPEPTVLDQVLGSSAFKQFTRTAAREIARTIFGTRRR
ncbi:helicase HerA-like domain-containing protein [Micrococcoides hystricis]|uniref:Helicase HerA-like domain-containing protein n=1 Tax=Micrococcoides hystricis TaxID=1572761 RepID=A0ABV6P8G0_9MICC